MPSHDGHHRHSDELDWQTLAAPRNLAAIHAAKPDSSLNDYSTSPNDDHSPQAGSSHHSRHSHDHDRDHDHGHSHEHAHSHSHPHTSGICCAKSHSSSEEWSLKELGVNVDEVNDSDPEKGPPNFERVVLSIDGLKCGCCEGGISRAVKRIPAIKNHKVNIVLARVEFDLNLNRQSIVEVIRKLSAETGYSFEEYSQPAGQVLELLVSDFWQLQRVDRPRGVTWVETPSIDRQFWTPSRLLSGRNSPGPTYYGGPRSPAKCIVDKCIVVTRQSQPVRIHFDASVIGARDIYDYYRVDIPDVILAPPPAHPSLAVGAKQTKRALYLFLFTFAFTVPVIVFAWTQIVDRETVYAHVSLVLASVVQTVALVEFVPSAARSLWHSRVFEMDFLIAASTTTAYVFSVVSYALQLQGSSLGIESFFETSTLLVTLILLGRVINEFARYRAAKSVSFRSLQAEEALLVLPESDKHADPKTRLIDSRLLQYGDSFKVLPHSKVVTDGTILYGGSEIDESMLTGESMPVAKGVHSKVFAGTTNGSGQLVVALTALPHENSVHKIASMVEDAELTKPKAQALADKIAGWFVPVIGTLGILVFMIWLFVGRFVLVQLWQTAAIYAITYAIATLIVSCPCAIGLAVPMVILIAGGVAARFGIIFRDAQKLEVARSVTDVVFDKTGTLTTGHFVVTSENFHDTNDTLLTMRILLGLLKDVRHPVGAGVYEHVARRSRMHPGEDLKEIGISDITSYPGKGVKGIITQGGREVRAGSPGWLDVNVEESNCSYLCVTVQGVLVATFKLKDQAKHNAEKVVAELQRRNMRVHMISGDGQGAVDDVAHSLNIAKKQTKSRCSPNGKMVYIRDVQAEGRVVMFVGDGTNDSVALKQADVGVHVNQGGSDVAKGAADVVLMTSRLQDVLILLDISKAAFRRIVANFGWSACYNMFAILLAAGAFVGVGKEVRIQPQWAGLGELVSVLPVVLIAFQMRWRNYGVRYRGME
jgi:heavy metal translocating P-type ATPase